MNIYRGYVITKEVEKFNEYDQLIYRAECIKKRGFVNNLMAFNLKDLKDIIKANK